MKIPTTKSSWLRNLFCALATMTGILIFIFSVVEFGPIESLLKISYSQSQIKEVHINFSKSTNDSKVFQMDNKTERQTFSNSQTISPRTKFSIPRITPTYSECDAAKIFSIGYGFAGPYRTRENLIIPSTFCVPGESVPLVVVGVINRWDAFERRKVV